jgi:hypothetical protein
MQHWQNWRLILAHNGRLNKMEGWIKLHRNIANWRWATSPNHIALFMQILIRANFKETHWRKEMVKPGQILTGRKQLSVWTGLSEAQIRTVLRDLQDTQEITIKTTKTYSIITIVNWLNYQIMGNESNQEITNKQPTNNQQITTSKNANNAKNEKNIIIKASPLEFLFPENESIKKWLQGGKKEVQESLLNDFSHHVLAEEIKKAYLWQSVKTKRKSDLFLLNWMSNKKTNGLGLNQAQARFSGHTTGNDITPQELERARELGII